MSDQHETYERFTILRRVDGRHERILASDGRDRTFATMAEAQGFAAFSGMAPGDYTIETIFCDAAGNPAVRRIHT